MSAMIRCVCALTMLIMGARYRTARIGESAKPCPTPTSAAKGGDTSPSHENFVHLPTRYERKKLVIVGEYLPICSTLARTSWFRDGKKLARSNASTLVWRSEAHPERTKCTRYDPASSMNFCVISPNCC